MNANGSLSRCSSVRFGEAETTFPLCSRWSTGEGAIRLGSSECPLFSFLMVGSHGHMSLTHRTMSAREAKDWRYLIEEARLKAVDARMVSGSGGMRGF
jgi:hypothetical protein